MPAQYQFCRVCRQNHDQGKGHRFSTKHKQRLDALLKKIQKNVQEVRFSLKNTMRLKANLGSRSKFWCHFCEQEICEDRSVFACAETIRHLASKQHVETVKNFWFENGGDVSKRHSFCISEADLGKWEEACNAVLHQDGPDLTGTEMIRIKAFPIIGMPMARLNLLLLHLVNRGLATSSRSLSLSLKRTQMA